MSTNFERGKCAGQWTREQVQQCGFSSAQACLDNAEQDYLQEKAELSRLSPQYAQKQSDYLDGVIAGTRESLQALMDQGM